MSHTDFYFKFNQDALDTIDTSNIEQIINSHPVFIPVVKAGEELHIDSYVIGGWVRDLFLGRPSKDVDIVTSDSGIALAQRTASILGDLPVSIFKNFGTAMIKSNAIEYEFVGARKESYSKASRNPEVAPGTIDDDQKRRDFTINTLSIALTGPNQGKLLDPFNGIKDLKNGILKTPLDPIQTFSDDPLRMMRAIRFASQFNF
ncbi:MAG: poly(A) polymerase, partial [Halieaceae bacterium]